MPQPMDTVKRVNKTTIIVQLDCGYRTTFFDLGITDSEYIRRARNHKEKEHADFMEQRKKRAARNKHNN